MRLLFLAALPLLLIGKDPDQRISRALNRLTWGPRPGDAEQVRRTGLKKWIDAQLNPGRITESQELERRLRPLESLRMSAADMLQAFPPPQVLRAYLEGRLPMPADPERRANVERMLALYKARASDPQPKPASAGMQALQRANSDTRRRILLSTAPAAVVAHDLLEAKVLRAVYSERQFEDVLVDFWFNHFNVFLDKGADRYLITSYERDVIRPHVLGKFRDLLGAVAEHPAMLFYLDNWQSVGPDSPAARRGRNARGLNENYARELFELHTLGVDAGYTQADVIEAARAFTGWTIRHPYRSPEFIFQPLAHDRGAKQVLGLRIEAGGGKEDGLRVLDTVARHPSTARFISNKLAQRFVSDTPPPKLIAAMARTFTKTDGDLRAVMKTMLQAKEFWSSEGQMTKIKSPLEMVVSALRATGAEVNNAFGVAQRVGQLGQPLYRKVEPTGYSNTGSEWVGSSGLLARMNFANALAQNRIPGVRVAQQTVSGLFLGSPEFQKR